MQQQFLQQLTAAGSKGLVKQIFILYNQFISIFPEQYQWIISLVIVLAVASFLWQLIKKNIIWIVLVLVVFPGLLPILKNLFDSLTSLFLGKQL
jgi:hypothetical protein